MVFAMVGDKWSPTSNVQEHFEGCFEHLREVVRIRAHVARSPHPNLTIERVEPIYLTYEETSAGMLIDFKVETIELLSESGRTLTENDLDLISEAFVEAHHEGPAALVRDLALDARNAAYVETIAVRS